MSTNADVQFVPATNKQICESWGGLRNFMLSYGLKVEDPNDVQEAHGILDAMREHDQRVWQEEQREKAQQGAGTQKN
jgi:hypothetical protein